MVFTWQCPLMFMSYSVCAFLAGLTVLVCTPLIQRSGGWNAGCNVSTAHAPYYTFKTDWNKIAVMYLTICAVAGATFVFCGFWIYHYVDLGFDVNNDDGNEEEAESLGNVSLQSSRAVPSPSEMMPQTFDFGEIVSYVRPGATRGT
jgi:hypothetical protein